MEIKVKRFIVDGVPQPVVDIVDRDCCLYCPLASLYLTLKEEFSHNTLMRTAYELRFFLDWLQKRKINIITRVKNGIFLKDTEVKSFCESSKHRINYEQYMVIPAHPTTKYFSNVMHQSSQQAATVAPNVTNGRIARTSDYLQFLHRELNQHVLSDKAILNYSRNQTLLQEGKRKEVTNGQKTHEHVIGQTIPNDIMEKMFEIIHADHPENPFTPLVKIRNKLIVELLVDTGIRRGALAKLKISDIHFEGRAKKVFISRTRKDETDQRPNKPEQKTQEHFVYPSLQTMNNLKEHIEKYRPLVQGSELHEFVFVAEKDGKNTKGHPISLDTINYIFERISKVLGMRVHPHLLRHCWNERFTDLGESENLSAAEVDKYRKLLMGWSPTSIMPSKYNKIRDIEKSQEIARKMQREIMSEEDQ